MIAFNDAANNGIHSAHYIFQAFICFGALHWIWLMRQHLTRTQPHLVDPPDHHPPIPNSQLCPMLLSAKLS